MLEKALKYIVGLNKANEIHFNGGTFVDKQMTQLKTPAFPTLKVNTLESIVAYLKKIKDERMDEGFPPTIVHIVDETTVELKNVAAPEEGRRDCMVRAVAEVPKFLYGEFHDAETFNIVLQSKFMDTDDKGTILQVVGNLKEDAVRTMTDDGVSQVTAVRTGVATVADVKVPNPVVLKPFRTFIEVEQPESKFIFRMREGGKCAIFEADGGAWKLEAKRNILNFLKENLQEEIESGKVVLIA